MKVIKTMKKRCLCCMEEHIVQTVEVQESNYFKGKPVTYTAIYEYCDLADEYLADEETIEANDLAMKNAYREQNHLLTTDHIIAIRNKYSISQKDLACLLGWGEKTITRYEGHQVQDMAHDSVLRKISEDPAWFLELLEVGRERVSVTAYEKYREKIAEAYEAKQDDYLRKFIAAQYIRYQKKPEYHGNTILNLDKVTDVINYFADSDRMLHLYKVKLMKLLWYADFLAYKRHGHSITGLVYTAMPMGALPIAHKAIIDLKGISYEEVEFDNGSGYRFIKSNGNMSALLTKEEVSVLDAVIERFGKCTKEQIVEQMHQETAYKETAGGKIIDYIHAGRLSIS